MYLRWYIEENKGNCYCVCVCVFCFGVLWLVWGGFTQFDS